MIIAGFPGVGKTVYFKENSEDCYDIDSGFFKYQGTFEYVFGSLNPNINDLNLEEISDRILSAYDVLKDIKKDDSFWKETPNWKFIYAQTIEKFETEGNKKYVLVSLLEEETTEYLEQNNLEIYHVYPSLECKDDYLERYSNRNDGRKSETFQNDEIFTKTINFLEESIDNKYKIPLEKGEYFVDAISQIEQKLNSLDF
jgi:hypothetical protein